MSIRNSNKPIKTQESEPEKLPLRRRHDMLMNNNPFRDIQCHQP